MAKTTRRHRLVVRTHNPWRVHVLPWVMLLAVAGLAWGSFEYGRLRAGYDRLAAARERDDLTSQIQDLRKNNDDLRERIVMLERSRQIDADAGEQVRQNLASLQDKVLKLREELAFYRGIVSPEDSKAGLKVQSFKLLAGGDEQRLFHYRIMLIQAMNHDNRVSGVVDVAVHGTRDGQPAVLQLTELAPDHAQSLKFSFRYFQDLEGDIFLPEHFVPSLVEVTVDAKGSTAEPIHESYNWQVTEG